MQKVSYMRESILYEVDAWKTVICPGEKGSELKKKKNHLKKKAYE